MEIRAEEISQIIRSQIRDYEKKVEVAETGTVLSVGDGIARVYGVEKCMAMELLEFPGGIFGLALNLEEDNVGVAILGEDTHIKEGDIVKRTGRIAQVPVGDAVLGRVIDPVAGDFRASIPKIKTIPEIWPATMSSVLEVPSGAGWVISAAY